MIYKTNFLLVIKLIFIITLIFIMFFFISTDYFEWSTFMFAFFLMIGLEIIYVIVKKNLVKIEIINNTIFFHYKFLIKINSFQKYELDKLSYSYKFEFGARGVQSKELRLYFNDEFILKISPGISGWSKEIIVKIKNDLKSLNINEKQ